MTVYDALAAPFVEFGFMRRALVACLALSIGSGPVGVLLLLRRMSLVGDAMSHAVLPGAAIGFLFGGLSLPAMGGGGMVAGLAVALLSGFVSRTTALREDASFAGFYLTSLAAGVLLVSLRGSNIDLLHVLFGTILAIDDQALLLIGAIASLTALTLALVYRPLIAECFDPGFLKAVGGRGSTYHLLFLFLVVVNLVAGFQALGTLMAVGLMMLPAAAARLWATSLPGLAAVATGTAFASGFVGLVASFHWGVASGPSIVLTASLFYMVAILFGRGGMLRRALRRRTVLAALLLLPLGTLPAAARPLEVVASFTILADMVHEVGGDRVHVSSLVGPNGDPHAYEPSPDDARRLKAADLVVVNGLGLEGWMTRLVAASGTKGTLVVATQGIAPLQMTEDGKVITDPHAWNSAAAAQAYVRTIAAALIAADPGGAPAYQANAGRYGTALAQLDTEARQRIAAIPPARRKVLTSHDAFGYFAAAYGVTFLSPVGLSTESEASAHQVAALIRQIKAEGIRTYFLESSNDPRLVQQVARATGARPGGTLYVEALSAPGGPAPNYAALFRGNLDKLVAAMQRD